MFEYLGTVLVSVDPGFDVLRYLTVRTIGGTITALVISILLGPVIINFLKSIQFEQYVREDGPKSHYKKTGTPTMGGLLILSSLIISTLLWADLGNRYIWVVLGVTIGFALIGFFDDYLKIKKKAQTDLPQNKNYFPIINCINIVSLSLLFSRNNSGDFFYCPLFQRFDNTYVSLYFYFHWHVCFNWVF